MKTPPRSAVPQGVRHIQVPLSHHFCSLFLTPPADADRSTPGGHCSCEVLLEGSISQHGGVPAQSAVPAGSGSSPSSADAPVLASCGACRYRKKYASGSVHYFKDCIIVKNRIHSFCPSASETTDAYYSPVLCTKDGCDCLKLYVVPAAEWVSEGIRSYLSSHCRSSWAHMVTCCSSDGSLVRYPISCPLYLSSPGCSDHFFVPCCSLLVMP